MIRKQFLSYLILFCIILTKTTFSASFVSDSILNNDYNQPNESLYSVAEEEPSWGPYSYMKGSIEKVQAATIVMGYSTGVMISDSFAITAAHVPLDGDELPDDIWARNVHGQTVNVTDVWYDIDLDFAVVKLEHPFDISCAVPIASSDALPHDTVFLVGHPNNVYFSGLGWSVSFGVAYGIQDDDMSCFDVNATGGFSGGPVCNSNGEVLSVLSYIGSGYYWPGEPRESPYFNQNAPVRNEILEQYMGYGTSYGAPLGFIQNFLAKYNITPKPGGDFSLPENKPDIPRVPFVSEEELNQIELVSPSSRHSTIAFGRDNWPIWPRPRGTGVLISDDLVLTASHVVEKDWTAHAVGFTNGDRYDGCTVLATHPFFDLAIVKLPQPAPEGYIPVSLAEHPIHWKDPGYTVGHPLGVWQPEGGWQVTAARGLGADKGGLVLRGSGQPGNSGGGIFNQEGELVGILTGTSSDSEVKSPMDVQDPHSTNYWPTAQPEYGSFISGVDYSHIKEFVSKYTIGGEALDYSYAVIELPDNRIATAGRTFNGTDNDITLNIYDENGNFADSFSATADEGWEAGRDLTVLPDGRIIVVGNTHDKNRSQFLTLCFNSDGSPVTDFGQNGQVKTSIGNSWDEAISVKVQDDGKILVAGTTFNGLDNDFAVVRYFSDGTLDQDFGSGGIFISDIWPTSDDYLMAMEIQKDQKIVLTGYSDLPEEDDTEWDFLTMRLEPNGNLDKNFGTQGWISEDIRNNSSHDAATCLAIQDDGKIVVGGYTDRGWNPDVAIVRYMPDGSLDPTFGDDGIALISDAGQNFPDFLNDIAIQDDGKFILTGENWYGTYPDNKYGSPNGTYSIAIWRLNPDGSIEKSWGKDGLISINSGQDDFSRGIAIIANAFAVTGYSYINGNSESKLYFIELNEPPTDITLSKSDIDENSELGSLVGVFSTVDPDSEDSFTYSLVSGEGDDWNGCFIISGDSLLTNVWTNFEMYSTYSIRVQAKDSRGNTFAKIFIINVNESIVGITDYLISLNEIKLFPNPVSGILNIETSENKTYNFYLISPEGKTLHNAVLTEHITELKMNNFASGLYIVLLIDNVGNIHKHKVIKR